MQNTSQIISLSLSLSVSLFLCLSLSLFLLGLTAIFRWTWVSLCQNVSILDFTGAKDDAGAWWLQRELHV